MVFLNPYIYKMISVELKGGLGNQLFQIMATIAHSIRSNTPFVFSESKFKDEGPNRPTYWKTLFRHLEPYLNTHNNIDAKDIRAYTPIYENDRKFDPIQVSSENSLLKGYYQNYHYFDDVYAQALEITGIDKVRKEVISNHVSPTNCIRISMHFRQGDYRPIQCYHPIMREYYYIHAMLHILNELKHDTETPIDVVCFYEESDKHDVETIIYEVRDILNAAGYSNIKYVMDGHKGLSDWVQLLVMSSCDHHIIANSTFSWWSAYLNPSETKIVCYPDKWVGHQLSYIYTAGLYVPNWHRILAFSPKTVKNCNCR